MCHITKVKNEMEPEKNLVNKNLEKASVCILQKLHQYDLQKTFLNDDSNN